MMLEKEGLDKQEKELGPAVQSQAQPGESLRAGDYWKHLSKTSWGEELCRLRGPEGAVDGLC